MFTLLDGKGLYHWKGHKPYLDYVIPHTLIFLALPKTKCKEYVYKGTKIGPRFIKAQYILKI